MEDGLTREHRDLLREYLSRNQRGPVYAETQEENILPVLRMLLESRVEVETLESTSVDDRANTNYQNRMAQALAKEESAMNRFKDKGVLQKHKMGPVLRSPDGTDIVMIAMQFRSHFSDGSLFKSSFWNEALKSYASVGTSSLHHLTC
jgi:hypothetical protein